MLDSEATYRAAFYRLVGTTSTDGALVENAEAVNQTADTCITHGIRAAQQYLLARGMAARWWTRSPALTFTGSDASTGGQSVALPDDFLRIDGNSGRSALVDQGFNPWGTYVEPEDDYKTGNAYYIKGTNLWLCRGAVKPDTLYLEYVKVHPAFTTDVTLDFPEDAAGLAIAYAADYATAEGWFPGDAEAIARISKGVQAWERTASRVARRARAPRKMTPPKRAGRYT